MGTLTDQEICIKLKNLYDETENKIKTNAMVSRAYIDKTSSDTINEKVNAQMNSIQAGIYNINPKFKEGSKNYEQTKKLVAETLASYEAALLELSQFYDGKIEQLILRKVELEAGLIGSILNDEFLREKLIGTDFDAKEYCETTAPCLAEAFTSAELAEKAATLLEAAQFYRSLYNDLRARVADYVVTSHSTFERMKMEAGFCGGEFDICTDKI